MKQKDVITIVLVSIAAGLFAFLLSSKVFSTPQDRAVQVKTVEAISTEFASPDKKYFNDQSINPTQTITIGDSQPQPAPAKDQSSEQR